MTIAAAPNVTKPIARGLFLFMISFASQLIEVNC